MIAIQPHKRRDHGVIIRHELFMHNNIYIVEMFRGNAICSVCNSGYCKHARLACQLEYQYQQRKKDPNLSSCMFCGRLAKKFCGVSICGTCAS